MPAPHANLIGALDRSATARQQVLGRRQEVIRSRQQLRLRLRHLEVLGRLHGGAEQHRGGGAALLTEVPLARGLLGTSF